MDAERELRADKALRDLFQQAGHQAAPVGIEARITRRIPVAAQTAVKKERSLIPPFAWVATGAVLVSSIGWLLAGSGETDGTSYFDSLRRSMPHFSFSGIFSSPWVTMGGASLIVLLGLEAILSHRTTALRIKS
jgi:hypothetical protein